MRSFISKFAQNYNALNSALEVLQDPKSYDAARQQQARQVAEQFLTEYPEAKAAPMVRKIVRTPANPGGAMGEQTEFGFQQGPNPKDFVERLRNGVRQFGKQFNEQTIRPYNVAIQQAMAAIKNLATMPNLSPDVEQVGNQLLQLFQQIQAADAEDAQLVSQLGEVAQQLSASATGAALGAPEAFPEGWHGRATEPTSETTALPVPTAQPTAVAPAPAADQSQNWMQRLRGMLPGGQPAQRRVPWDVGVGA